MAHKPPAPMDNIVANKIMNAIPNIDFDDDEHNGAFYAVRWIIGQLTPAKACELLRRLGLGED